jgi:hypothetical protein
MSLHSTTELARFHTFVASCLVETCNLSPEEALDLWRAENPSASERAETVLAVREALQACEAGDEGIPLDVFDRQMRRSYQFGE